MKIRHIEIKNFRGIRELSWAPAEHVNCLVGPGDSGKTTIIDAIELALSPRYQITVDDSDFYGVNPENQIAITVTLGDLPPKFIAISRYGTYTRGWDTTSEQIVDEPDEASRLETVLSARFTVDRTLEPKWMIYTDRVIGEDPKFRFEDRQIMAPSRLGIYTDRHLGWGRQSILARLSGKERIGADALGEAVRAARAQFDAGGEKLFADVVGQVGKLARLVGVKLSDDISARLDVQGVSVNSGGISLHDGDLPLRVLGAGSARLLVAVLQDYAGENAPFALVDEVEHGLEPHRISRLLKYFKCVREGKPPQLFLTTHSPVVLQELAIDDLTLVRRELSTGKVTAISAKTNVTGVDAQAQLRSNPTPYLARSVLVCEGKTEVGIVRGLDQYWAKLGQASFATVGVIPSVAGGKDNAPQVAMHFRKLSYRVALFLDGDQNPDDSTVLPELKKLGATIIRWEKGKATEDVLFRDLHDLAVSELVRLLEDEEELTEIIPLHINTQAGRNLIRDWKQLRVECTQPSIRNLLAVCAKKHGWIKNRLSLSEAIGLSVLGPYLGELSKTNAATIAEIRAWIDDE